MAWSKLDAMLTAADSSNSEQAKQTKAKFPWMYVAASFVGFLLLEQCISIKKTTVKMILVQRKGS
jgi:hypothetical protein